MLGIFPSNTIDLIHFKPIYTIIYNISKERSEYEKER